MPPTAPSPTLSPDDAARLALSLNKKRNLFSAEEVFWLRTAGRAPGQHCEAQDNGI